MANSIFQICRLDHIAIRTLDWEKSLDFYVNGLGMRQQNEWGEAPERAAMLELGTDGRIELFEGGTTGEKPPLSQVGEWVHLAINFDDVDLAFERACAHGGTPANPPKDLDVPARPEPMNVRLAFVQGPSGEVIEICKNR
ncbi:VOC family protein [Feifania hominis]|uniref:VOC family protein n=1 Tax=Feifania hominis TaxID=2763660 RepID=A0A926DDH0_9FIRM|nr:VOC family protein [Feifania hominis]MBC8536176.1 VOC family protein [Feifania hominis]